MVNERQSPYESVGLNGPPLTKLESLISNEETYKYDEVFAKLENKNSNES